MKVGARVSWNSSGGTARGIVREIIRDGKVPNIPVKITGTEEEPAARIEITDDEGKPTGQMVGHKVSTLRKCFDVEKAQYANDIFTTEQEAVARSYDMGLEGKSTFLITTVRPFICPLRATRTIWNTMPQKRKRKGLKRPLRAA